MKTQPFSFDLVVAMDAKRGIGIEWRLPWHLPGDMAYFRSLTMATHVPRAKNAVLMGRRTWESIPERFQPLPKRRNVILTRQTDYAASEADVFADFESALADLEAARRAGQVDRVFVIGGASVYEQALAHPACQKVYVTCIDQTFKCDCFFS